MTNYVFVYGSLKSDCTTAESAQIVKSMRLIGNARIRGQLYDFGTYVGACIDAADGSFVFGELVQLPNRGFLKVLDRYEEYDSGNAQASLFVRRKVRVFVRNGRKVAAWVYVYRPDTGMAPVIPGGVFSNRKRGKIKRDESSRWHKWL